jgi:hypothetical protein
MSGFFNQLTRLYASAIGFLAAVVLGLAAVAMLARYVTVLCALIVLLTLARVVWARTQW